MPDDRDGRLVDTECGGERREERHLLVAGRAIREADRHHQAGGKHLFSH
jgi:hypothetical protein